MLSFLKAILTAGGTDVFVEVLSGFDDVVGVDDVTAEAALVLGVLGPVREEMALSP